MPVVDAMLLIFNRIESMRIDDEMPPGPVRHIMSFMAKGKKASLDEVEKTIEFLEEKRVQLGGKRREGKFLKLFGVHFILQRNQRISTEKLPKLLTKF